MKYTKIFTREYSVQYADACVRMVGPEGEGHIPMILLSAAYIPIQGNEAFCFETNEWQEFYSRLIKDNADPVKQKKFFERFHELGRQYVATARELGALPVAEMSAEELIQAYEKYFDIYVLYTLYLWVGFLLNDVISQQGNEVLLTKKLDPSTERDVMAALFYPSQKSGILKLQEELGELKTQGVKKLDENVIARLLKDYAWMPCMDLQKEPWQESDIVSFYNQLTAESTPVLSFGAAAQEAGLMSDEEELFKRIKEFAYIKDVRDVYRRQGVYAVQPWYAAVGQKLGVDLNTLAFVTKEELIIALRGQSLPKAEEISKRQKEFLVRREGQGVIAETDPTIIECYRSYLTSEEQKVAEVRGLIACKGHVQGRARLVTSVHDLDKVRVGDILISITTHPDFVPAMQKAAAFVTDEGGLTSHAAIVAREMKKPCIVGTKIATQTIKDGDMVEVDADKGVVRIIN